jgi:hypothetical protein
LDKYGNNKKTLIDTSAIEVEPAFAPNGKLLAYTSTKFGKPMIFVKDLANNNNTRIMLLSATPAVNNPFEFALIFNLLRPGSFPTSEAIFEQVYISTTNYQALNENTHR